MVSPFRVRFLVASVAVLGVTAGAAHGQPQGEVTDTSRPLRIIRSWEESVKTSKGDEFRRIQLVIDYRKGTVRQNVYDAEGRLRASRPVSQVLPSPSQKEIEEAFEILREDAEIGRIIERFSADLTGGFVVQEARGRPCGPGARCLLMMVISSDHFGLIRRSVVDLARRSVAYRTLEPGDIGASR